MSERDVEQLLGMKAGSYEMDRAASWVKIMVSAEETHDLDEINSKFKMRRWSSAGEIIRLEFCDDKVFSKEYHLRKPVVQLELESWLDWLRGLVHL
jgi:hypothetical protein